MYSGPHSRFTERMTRPRIRRCSKSVILLITLATLILGLRETRRVNALQNEGASVIGSVQDDQGLPVPDAKVTLTRQGVPASVLTHADGKFEFKKLLPGPCDLTVEVAGFRKATLPLMISRPNETLLQVVKLTPSSLHVAVFDAGSRQPLNGVTVSLGIGDRPAPAVASSLTDERGDAYFGRLAPGSYRLTASLRGYEDYQSVVFISSGKITTEFALPLSIAPVIPINDKASSRYNVPNIPSKNVQAVFQDSDGWMWFGTDKGVARFNGSDFRSSSTSGSSFSWLAGADVRSIAEDSSGQIWLGTTRGVRKVGKDGSDSGQFLDGVDVRQILADKEKNLWIATSEGEYEVSSRPNALPVRLEGLPSADVRATAEDRGGRIFVATAAGVFVLANKALTPFDLRPLPVEAQASSTDKGTTASATGSKSGSASSKPPALETETPEVRSIFADRDGTLWFATSAGVEYFDGKLIQAVQSDALKSPGSTAGGYVGVTTIGQDAAGRLWFGLDGGGALLYGPERREGQRIGLVERDRVSAIFADREGNLWFGTDNGALRADLYSFVDFNTSRGLSDNDVRAVIEKPPPVSPPNTRSTLLFATAGGVSVMQRERLIPLEGFKASIGVRSIAYDRNGDAWFATGQGVFRLSAQSLTQYNEGNGLVSDNVNWVGGASGGSIVVLGTSKGLGLFRDGALVSVDPLSGFDVRQVEEGPNGRLWCSTNRGIVVYNPSTGESTLIDTGRGLADNDVRWIVADRGRMIIASATEVQSCNADVSTSAGKGNVEFETVDNEGATALYIDRDRYIWIGTDDGQVKKFAMISGQYVSTVYSGETAALSGKRINSFYDDSEGHIWIATSGGVVRHTPVRSAPLARVSAESDSRSLQSGPADERQAYELPYGAGKLTFRFTGVSLDGQIRYLYRLKGPNADEPWRLLPIQQAAEREVSIPGVSEGAFTFELMALNRDLYGSKSPAAELSFRIGPPFWRHTWFYLIAISILAGIVAAAYMARRIEHREYTLPKELRTFVPIEPNPYIVGNPIRTEKMFFGREDDFRYTRTKLEGVSQGVVIVFCGERRVGKSSILYQVLNGRLGERFVPVFVDMQEMVISSDSEFFSRVSRLIRDAVARSASSVPAAQLAGAGQTRAAAVLTAADDPDSAAQTAALARAAQLPTPVFEGRNPYPVFLDFLDEVLRILDHRTLLILVDEYELLESKVDEGKLSHELFTFLAGLMDNKERLALMFTGSRRLEERDRKYWRELLRRSLFRKVSFLSEKDTVRLITEPVEGRVVYGKEVVERVYRLTAGQPFYAQVTCQNIVDFLNEEERNWFTLADLDHVVDDILDNPLPQMIYAWDGLSDDEKIALSLLADTLRDPLQFATAGELRASVKVNNYPVNLSENTIRLTLEEMFRRDFLDKDAAGGFRFRMDLFRLWVHRAHSIWQVVNEVRTL